MIIAIIEGRAGARVAGVPVGEQYVQDGTLAQFYARNGIGQGDRFQVVVGSLE